MSNLLKEPRTCECGYTTSRRDSWSHHKKRCTQVTTIGDKERIASLERQLVAKDEQMKANQEQLKAKDEQIVELVKRLIEVRTPPPVKPGATKGTKRKKMTEPQRRKIALRQNFKCANPDGKCKLTDVLEEYDVDHVIPLFQDGDDEEWNMQALCPACHRRKTEREALQSTGVAQVVMT